MSTGLIQSITYDAEKLELRIHFSDGRITIHRSVPDSIRAAFVAAASQADFYMTYVREQFPRA